MKSLKIGLVTAVIVTTVFCGSAQAGSLVISFGSQDSGKGVGFFYQRETDWLQSPHHGVAEYRTPTYCYPAPRVPRRQEPIRDAYGRPYIPGDWGNARSGYLRDHLGRPYIPGDW